MSDLDFLAPEFLADPYPAYHRLRTAAPVHRHPAGFFVLTRYDDVSAFLRDPRFDKSGYGLVVDGLAPGTYDIAVFAYSTVIGGFAPPKTVRVTVR